MRNERKAPRKIKYRSPRKKLELALDNASRDYIIKRDKKCVICGSVDVLQNSHYITRGHHYLRWDPRNQHTMCRRCHFIHHHGGEYIYANFMSREYNQLTLDDLETKANVPAWQWSISELEEILATLRRLISDLQ